MPARKQQQRNDTEDKSSSAWRWWVTAIGSGLGAILLYVGARGGPEVAWLEFREFFGLYQEPKIVSFLPDNANAGIFILSVENPNLRGVQITQYVATPLVEEASYPSDSGPLAVMKVEEDRPEPC